MVITGHFSSGTSWVLHFLIQCTIFLFDIHAQLLTVLNVCHVSSYSSNPTTLELVIRHVHIYSNNPTSSNSVVRHVKNYCANAILSSVICIAVYVLWYFCFISIWLWKRIFDKSGIMRLKRNQWNMILEMDWWNELYLMFDAEFQFNTLPHDAMRSLKDKSDFYRVDMINI